MKLFSLLAVFTLSISPMFASQYVGVQLGTDNMNLTNVSHSGLKIGYKAGMKYGYVFENGFRPEFECSYRKSNYSTKYAVGPEDQVFSKEYNNFHSWSYMVNGFYDLGQLAVKQVVPYLGIGVGYCQNVEHKKMRFSRGNSISSKFRDNRFAYQGIAGVKYALDDVYSTNVEYHYFCGKAHAKSHSVELALVRNF
jgi:opacity protein-like surface antigen